MTLRIANPWWRAWLALITLQFPVTVLVAVLLASSPDPDALVRDIGHLNAVTVSVLGIGVFMAWLTLGLARWVRMSCTPGAWRQLAGVGALLMLFGIGWVVLPDRYPQPDVRPINHARVKILLTDASHGSLSSRRDVGHGT